MERRCDLALDNIRPNIVSLHQCLLQIDNYRKSNVIRSTAISSSFVCFFSLWSVECTVPAGSGGLTIFTTSFMSKIPYPVIQPFCHFNKTKHPCDQALALTLTFPKHKIHQKYSSVRWCNWQGKWWQTEEPELQINELNIFLRMDRSWVLILCHVY